MMNLLAAGVLRCEVPSVEHQPDSVNPSANESTPPHLWGQSCVRSRVVVNWQNSPSPLAGVKGALPPSCQDVSSTRRGSRGVNQPAAEAERSEADPTERAGDFGLRVAIWIEV